MRFVDMRGGERHGELAGALEIAFDGVVADELLEVFDVLQSHTGHPPRLIDAKMGDRQLVRVIDGATDLARVASATAVARNALFEDDNIKLRLKLLQEIGGPQSGEPRADDGNVRVAMPFEWRTRHPVMARRQPETGAFNGLTHADSLLQLESGTWTTTGLKLSVAKVKLLSAKWTRDSLA